MSVHKLSDYRKQEPKKASLLPTQLRWFCMNCNGGQFKMYENHEAYCCNCGSRIRNVKVVPV